MEKQITTINVLYFIFVFSTILGFVPFSIAQTASFVLIAVVLLAAYFYRTKDSEGGLLYNHMTYLIGTIWIGTSVILIGVLIAGFWVFSQGDSTVIDNAIANIQGSGQMPSDSEWKKIGWNYVKDNEMLLMMACFFAIGPTILYFVYRVANGIARAGKGYRIANPRSWL